MAYILDHPSSWQRLRKLPDDNAQRETLSPPRPQTTPRPRSPRAIARIVSKAARRRQESAIGIRASTRRTPRSQYHAIQGSMAPLSNSLKGRRTSIPAANSRTTTLQGATPLMLTTSFESESATWPPDWPWNARNVCLGLPRSCPVNTVTVIGSC